VHASTKASQLQSRDQRDFSAWPASIVRSGAILPSLGQHALRSRKLRPVQNSSHGRTVQFRRPMSRRNIKRTPAFKDFARSVTMSNPKTEPTDNTRKDPDEWVSGDDPMTGAQGPHKTISLVQLPFLFRCSWVTGSIMTAARPWHSVSISVQSHAMGRPLLSLPPHSLAPGSLGQIPAPSRHWCRCAPQKRIPGIMAQTPQDIWRVHRHFWRMLHAKILTDNKPSIPAANCAAS
jgi:hypothetical protein